MTYDPSKDVAATFRDCGSTVVWDGDAHYETKGLFYAPGTTAQVGVPVCTSHPTLDYATAELPGLGAGHVLTVTLTPAQLAMYNASTGAKLANQEVVFTVRDATPVAGGFITRATLKRTTAQ